MEKFKVIFSYVAIAQGQDGLYETPSQKGKKKMSFLQIPGLQKTGQNLCPRSF